MYLTAIDLGSSQIKVLVANIGTDGELLSCHLFKEFSKGIRKGEIVDINEAAASLGLIFNKIKEIDKLMLKNIFVNIGGANISCQTSKGIVAVARADNEISSDDIDRVIKASQAIKLLPNRVIIHTLTKDFIIDGIGDIREPLGMNGTRLEVNSVIIDVFSPNVKNILNLIDSLGGSISGIIYNPLAAASSVLTKNQKDLGVVLIDIGFGTTAVSVYEEGKLLHAASFPIGSGNITNDLAIGLRCSVRAAELVKRIFGRAISSEISAKEKITPAIIFDKSGIDIKELDRNFKSSVSLKFVAEIIESRLIEIFELVNSELKLINRFGQLPAGAVLCGGGVKIPEIVDLAKKELKLSVEIGMPELREDMEFDYCDSKEELGEPEFATLMGLLYWGVDKSSNNGKWLPKDKLSLKKIINYFMP